MAKPNDTVMQHCTSPLHVGEIEGADAIGFADLDGRAPRVSFYIKVQSDRLTEIRYQTFGCGFMIACCSILADMLQRRTLQECLATTAEDLEQAAGGLPPQKKFCADLAIKSIHHAVTQLEVVE